MGTSVNDNFQLVNFMIDDDEWCEEQRNNEKHQSDKCE
jgi:hypothetical protein